MQNLEFEGSPFWISGASSGIGLAVAERLAAQGASLFIMSRSSEGLQQKVDHLKKLGAQEVIVAPLNIADPTTPARVVEILGGRKLRGVLLNAGGPRASHATDIKWEDHEYANRLLIAGPIQLLLALVPHLESPGGSVVGITSTSVKEPFESLPLSGAYRAGFVALLKSLADELGPRGIRVNNVAPGYTATERLSSLMKHTAAHQHGDEGAAEEVAREWGSTIPLRRLATPEEVAAACNFLFSSQASYITGQTLVVDGGKVRGY